jgi:hypothetical protein
MKPPRTALPLPRQVQRKPLKGGGWGYFFNISTKARKAGCPLHNEALGTDYDIAVERAEKILNVFDAWLKGGAPDAPTIATTGTLDWLFGEYKSDRRFTKLDAKTRRNHENGFKLVGCHVLKDGRRLGQARVSAIDTAITDCLYEALLPIKDSEGNVIGERRTTVNHAMKTCRRAWNIVARRHPGKLPLVNPFAQMGLRSSDRETPTATYEELMAFRAKAVEMGLPSLATAALIGWEWLQREVDIFATFSVSHYRPKESLRAAAWVALMRFLLVPIVKALWLASSSSTPPFRG